jgi:hypothetical protein
MVFREIVVKKGQSLTDISIQEYGNIEGVFALMVDNTIKLNAMSDVLVAGTILRIRKINPYAIQTAGNHVTNTNPLNTLGNGYVATGYIASGYMVSSITDIGKINKGISEFQLELIN